MREMKDGRTRVSMQELRDLASEVNRLLRVPADTYYVEILNDSVQLSQSEVDGGTTVMLGPANRGALLKLIDALLLGIQLGQRQQER